MKTGCWCRLMCSSITTRLCSDVTPVDHPPLPPSLCCRSALSATYHWFCDCCDICCADAVEPLAERNLLLLDTHYYCAITKRYCAWTLRKSKRLHNFLFGIGYNSSRYSFSNTVLTLTVRPRNMNQLIFLYGKRLEL